MYLLQDWTTIAGNGTTPFVQSILEWADLARYTDAYFWLEVRAVQNPGAGSLTLRYETAPARDGTLFQPVATVTVVAGTTPTISKVRLIDNPAVPLARWLRWSLQGTASGDWLASFRIFLCGGPSRAGAFSAETDNQDGWWRASYGGVPFAPSASAGTSGSAPNLTNLGASPTVGAAVNGFTPWEGDGATSNRGLGLATGSASDVLNATVGTMIVLAKGASASAATANYYDDVGLVCAAAGNHGIAFTSSGVRAGVFDGAAKQTTFIAVATGVWFMAAMRWTQSATVKCRVATGGTTTDATPVAVGGAIGALGANFFVLKNYAGTGAVAFDGQMLEVVTFKRELADAELDNWKAYFNARYGLSL